MRLAKLDPANWMFYIIAMQLEPANDTACSGIEKERKKEKNRQEVEKTRQNST
jgi:hypothetical protein